MNTNVVLTVGGEVLDLNENTQITLEYRGDWLLEFTKSCIVSYDFKIPNTRKNSDILELNNVIYSEGVRRRKRAAVAMDAAVLCGWLYVIESSEREHSVLFTVSQSLLNLDIIPVRPTGLSLVYRSKTPPTYWGTIPDFGWYSYDNAASDGTLGNPPNLFPVANLGKLLDYYATSLGLSIQYPTPSLGRMYQAAAYGLVLDRMNVYNYTSLIITGSALTGWTASGGTLSGAGLTVESVRLKRGAFNENVTAYVLQAVRSVRIQIAAESHVVFVRGQGYELLNDWDGREGLDITLNAGEYLAAVSRDDDFMWFGSHKWNGGLAVPAGYSTVVSFSVTVIESSQVVQEGSVLTLDTNLPSLTFEELLRGYCQHILATYRVVGDRVVVMPYVELFQHLEEPKALEECQVVEVVAVRRYIDGWAQSNIIRCKSVGDLVDFDLYKRVLICDNDYLEEEREFATMPFNEGSAVEREDGRLGLWVDNIELGQGENRNYKGILTLFYENDNPEERGGIHLKQTLLDGLGGAYSEFTSRAVTMVVKLIMSVEDFTGINLTSTYSYNGRVFVVRGATWQEGMCELTLLSVNN